MWIKMGITYCEQGRQARPLGDGWLVTQTPDIVRADER